MSLLEVMRRSPNSLSGYVRTANGRLLEFSMLCNNWTTPQAAVDRVQDAIGAALAHLRLR